MTGSPSIYFVPEKSRRPRGRVSGYPTRFFWTEWLTNPRLAYRRAEWLAEDRAALERHPPRYVVVFKADPTGLNAPSYFAPLGYEERARFESLGVMERVEKRSDPPP